MEIEKMSISEIKEHLEKRELEKREFEEREFKERKTWYDAIIELSNKLNYKARKDGNSVCIVLNSGTYILPAGDFTRSICKALAPYSAYFWIHKDSNGDIEMEIPECSFDNVDTPPTYKDINEMIKK